MLSERETEILLKFYFSTVLYMEVLGFAKFWAEIQ